MKIDYDKCTNSGLYCCDAGSLEIDCGNDNLIRIDNCYGDGKFFVGEINEKNIDIFNDDFSKEYERRGTMYLNNAKILNYDCFVTSNDNEKCHFLKKKILFVLKGYYAVYARKNSGSILFVKLGE